jgi:hypothetical protein
MKASPFILGTLVLLSQSPGLRAQSQGETAAKIFKVKAKNQEWERAWRITAVHSDRKLASNVEISGIFLFGTDKVGVIHNPLNLRIRKK